MEYKDTTGSEGKKVMNALSFYKMETDEVSKRYTTPCFVNGLEAYDGEINLEYDENLISNEENFLYLVKFIINLEEDDVEPGVILGRSFMRQAKGIVDFSNGVITVYPKPDPFEDDSEKTEKSPDDWDQLLDFNFDDVPKFEEELPPLVCKMGKSSRNRKRSIKNLSSFYQDIGPSLSAGGHITQEEAQKEALAIRISQKFTLLKELDGKIVKEEEEAIKKVKGEALKEKDDPEAFIFPIKLEGNVNKNALAHNGSDINTMPYRIYETLGREKMKKADKGITMINHTQAEAMGILTNVLCQVGVTTIIAKFIILDIPIDRDASIVVVRVFIFDVLRTAESDSDDEEEYQIKWNKFGAPIYGLKLAPYLNCTGLNDRSSAIQTNVRRTSGKFATLIASESHRTLWERTMMRSDHQDPNALDSTRQWKKCFFYRFIMNFCYGKVVAEKQSLELCHEFYSTYEFDEVCTDDELQTKKIIKFRLDGRAHILTLLEFARRLGLYQAVELDEEGFNVYIKGGLRNDEHFNTQEYWLSISRKENLVCLGVMLLLSNIQRQNGYANVAWLIARWMKRKGAGTQKESQICYGQFISKIARKSRVLTDDVLRSLSAPVWYSKRKSNLLWTVYLEDC
ncbi:hypothetical protein Tco_0331476 [Tanacetum coccineum]